MSEIRKQHVVRVYGKNETADGGPDNSNRWVDLAVIGDISYDAPSSKPPGGEPGGQAKYLQRDRVTDPDVHYIDRDGKNLENQYKTYDARVVLDREDSSQYVILKINQGLQVDTGSNFQYTRIEKVYHSGKDDDPVRKNTLVKVIQNAIDDDFLQIDQDSDNPDQKIPPRNPDDYLNAVIASGSSDTDQFLVMEMIDEFQIDTGTGSQHQKVKFELEWKQDRLLSLDNALERSETDGEGMNPVRLDPLQSIINYGGVTLYAVIGVSAGNSAGELWSSVSVGVPTIEVTANKDKNLKKLDEYRDPDGNKSTSGFGGCFHFIPEQTGVVGWEPMVPGGSLWQDPIMGPVGESRDAAWKGYRDQVFSYGRFLEESIEGKSCNTEPSQLATAYEGMWDSTGLIREETWYVNTATVPMNYGAGEGKQVMYLYKIVPGEDLFTITVSGLEAMDRHDTGGKDGGGSIAVSVYSTAREKIKKLEQLVDLPPYDPDDAPQTRIDPDDTRTITLDSKNQGAFKISVKSADAGVTQTDNYGRQFHPFKVIFDPAGKSEDRVPRQPPERLPLPSKQTS